MFCGVLSIICGIIGAFTEKLIKRFFVYSSMGHVGFMLLGISTFSINGATASINYLFVYILSSLIL
jgi:NADH:ubiquinone oxidoreductase subunit 2 (subunit N)